MKKWITYLACILGTELLGFAAGMATREGTKIYAETINKPPLSPPGIAFPIAWTILYALMGFALARVILAEKSPARKMGIYFYAGQLVFNLAWCFIFFGAQRFDIAFFWLLVMFGLVVAMVVNFKKVDGLAWKTQIPYLCWLVFAGYLNVGVWVMN